MLNEISQIPSQIEEIWRDKNIEYKINNKVRV